MRLFNYTMLIVILTLFISCASHDKGKFISIELSDGDRFRAFSSGQEEADAGVLIVHD